MGKSLRSVTGAALRAAMAVSLITGLASVGTVVAAGGSTPASPGRAPAVRAVVVPVPGDRFAPPGTSITIRGDVGRSALAGFSVVGSESGVHAGTFRALPGGGAVFTPARPFAGGEEVTVRAPGLEVPGGRNGTYTFGTARPASRSEASAAFRVAASEDGTGPARHGKADIRAPQPCALTTYRSEPELFPQQLCMNLGVTTSGTQPGTYLFLTPGGQGGNGIWADNGDLVWWRNGIGQQDLDETVIQYQGHPYLALWSGKATTFGDGTVSFYNEHYQKVGEVTAAGGFAANQIDLHEFRVTPSGDALFGIYEAVNMTVNGQPRTVLQYVVQKVSLVDDATGIHTGNVLFEWDSLSDVPVSQTTSPDPGPGVGWDYFHGNAISEDTDGNLVVSARNTWGIYKIDDTPADAGFGHVIWQVGAAGDSQLAEPWCFQHDVDSLGNNEYSLFDDGGFGPGCVPGSTQHPARALIFTVNPATKPAGVTLVKSYTHSPPINTLFTGSAQVLATGDMLVDWANVPEMTEYDAAGTVKMDLSMSSASYRGFRFAWDGQPLTPPSLAAHAGNGTTTVWASWNGSTEVSAWQVRAGSSPASLADVGGRQAKTGFETAITLPAEYPVVEVQALNSQGAVLGTSAPVDTAGYLLATSAGAVSPFGDAVSSGSAAPGSLGAPAVGIAETPDGHGYWLVASDGAVQAFGDAHLRRSLVGTHFNAPVVGMGSTADGGGYWVVAADGGVFALGDAKFRGSLGGSHLNAPVVGIEATPDGDGYWLVAADGGMFAFGDAKFRGSLGGSHLNAPVAGMAATPDGEGYWLAAADGGVFRFGDARFHGSAAGAYLGAPVVAIAASPDGGGYWLVSAHGTVLGFGDSPGYGPTAGDAPSTGVVGIGASRS